MTNLIERAKQALEDDSGIRPIAFGRDFARALVAADELADAAKEAHPFIGYEANVPEIEDRLWSALKAYHKVTGGQS